MTWSCGLADVRTAARPYRPVPRSAISTSSSAAAAAAPQTQPGGLVAGGAPLPPSESLRGKPRAEVPLPSQEGTKGLIQYALYVGLLFS